MTAYDITTRKYLGTAKVLGSAELTSESELVPLMGGSSKYAWKVERGVITAELSLTFREYPPFLFQTLLGKSITENAAETGGSVTTITNAKGTSIVASTGLASVSIKSGSETDVKFSYFVVEAASSTTVNVYAATDVDFGNGTNKTFENDLLKITSTALTITSSTAVDIPGFGLQLTGGAGTIGMTTGDTATFSSRPINSKSTDVIIGSSSEVFTDFGLILSSQKQGDGEITLIDCFRVAGAGLPINFGENAFSEASVTMSLYRDVARDGVYQIKTVKATNS
jgi:hypothetical protein